MRYCKTLASVSRIAERLRWRQTYIKLADRSAPFGCIAPHTRSDVACVVGCSPSESLAALPGSQMVVPASDGHLTRPVFSAFEVSGDKLEKVKADTKSNGSQPVSQRVWTRGLGSV